MIKLTAVLKFHVTDFAWGYFQTILRCRISRLRDLVLIRSYVVYWKDKVLRNQYVQVTLQIV